VQKLKNFYNENKEQLDKYLPILYFFILIVGFFQIKAILNSPDVEVQRPPQKEEEEKRDEKEIDVSLQIVDASGSTIKTYVHRIENEKTVDDYLQELRKSQDLNYEKVEYLDGLKIESVLDFQNNTNFAWQIYMNEENVTKMIEQVSFIERDDIRNLRLVLEPLKK
jgi:hypothetical protein